MENPEIIEDELDEEYRAIRKMLKRNHENYEIEEGLRNEIIRD